MTRTGPRPTLTVFAPHVIQYQAPLYAELAQHHDLDLHVAFFSDKGVKPYFDAGFGRRVQWDIDLLAGYEHSFVPESWLRRLLSVIAQIRRSDVILVHGHSAPWMLITTVLAIMSRTPYLLRGDSWVEGTATGWRRTVRNAVVRLVVGPSAAGLANGIRNADFYRAFGCRDVVMAPYSVDIERFRTGADQARGGRRGRLRALGLNPDIPTIVSAGKLTPVKRPMDLVAALPLMQTSANLIFIGDGELADTADAVVSLPEIFNYWLQPGRIQVGFLSAAQIDKRGNINTTVIGPYDNPKVRLPGAGGAPEIPASCAEVIVVVRHSTRVFVNEVGFVTSVGFGRAKGDRQKYGLRGKGPQRIITDLGVLQPDADGEFILTAIHPGVSVEQVKQATGWDLRVATELSVTPEPTKQELRALRHLETTKGQS